MSCNIIDYNRLAFVKEHFLKDTGIVKRQVFVLDPPNNGKCWHCWDNILLNTYHLPLKHGNIGYFCSVNCVYSYLILRNISFHESASQIINRIRSVYDVSTFYIIPPGEFIGQNKQLIDAIKILKSDHQNEAAYDTIIYPINNQINYIIYKQ